jgi:predicted aconitase
MLCKKKICYQDKTGKPAFREATPEELAAMQPHTTDWHSEKPFRVTVSNDVWKDWFAKKRDHADYLELTGQQLYPDLIALLDVVKSIDNSNIVNDSENTYVYLDEVFDSHVPIISKYNAIVETKPLNQ